MIIAFFSFIVLTPKYVPLSNIVYIYYFWSSDKWNYGGQLLRWPPMILASQWSLRILNQGWSVWPTSQAGIKGYCSFCLVFSDCSSGGNVRKLEQSCEEAPGLWLNHLRSGTPSPSQDFKCQGPQKILTVASWAT